MILTQDEQDQVLENIPIKTCSTCGSDDLGVDNHYVVYHALRSQKKLPVVLVHCNSCGLVLTFDARSVGLNPQDRFDD